VRALFVTDLHGSTWKYERTLALARHGGFPLVINGGDMLPSEGELFRQGEFIHTFLTPHFAAYDQSGIHYLCFLGNDDLRIFDDLLVQAAAPFGHVQVLAQRRVEIGAYEFIGLNWVADYPFQLKDRCRRDTEAFLFPKQYGPGLLSTPEGWQRLPDWPAYARTLPTLAEELANLPLPRDAARSIYVMHMPPARLELDVCHDGRRVGSQAVYDFLAARQPRLSLHGHIHESPRMSGRWQTWLGGTLCLQPGQELGLCYLTLDLDTRQGERHVARRFR
jgi:Icc-related predicted phosphoesterase